MLIVTYSRSQIIPKIYDSEGAKPSAILSLFAAVSANQGQKRQHEQNKEHHHITPIRPWFSGSKQNDLAICSHPGAICSHPGRNWTTMAVNGQRQSGPSHCEWSVVAGGGAPLTPGAAYPSAAHIGDDDRGAAPPGGGRPGEGGAPVVDGARQTDRQSATSYGCTCPRAMSASAAPQLPPARHRHRRAQYVARRNNGLLPPPGR